MGSIIKGGAMASAACVVIASGSAMATTMKVNVPFEFTVHGQSMPAGMYRLEEDAQDPSVILIESMNGARATALTLTTTAAGRDPAGEMPALTFRHTGSQYQLVDVWDSGDEGHELAQTAHSATAQPSHASHATTGTVRSIDANTMVLMRNGSRGDMTFVVNPATHRDGTVAVGSAVSVRYTDDGAKHVATAITAKKTKS